MKKVLLITDVNFWAKGAGHRMRITNLVEYLAENCELTIVYVGIAPPQLENFLNASLKSTFYILEKFKDIEPDEYGQKLKDYIGKKQFDSIIIEYIHLSYFLNYIPESSKVFLDTHDIISDRTDDFKKYNYEGYLFEMSKDAEFEIFSVYDYIIVLCEPDHIKISSEINSEKVLLCPHPSKISKHHQRKTVHNIAFVASEYWPNRDAIYFFILNCWPQIISKYNVQLSIYGNIAKNLTLPNYDHVIVKGYVSDLNQIYDEADIIINPVRFGAGLKIKNIEALANGIPLVTTSHGARGLEAVKNTAFLVADEKEDFVSAIGSLIESATLRKSLSQNAHTFIAEKFSSKVCFNSLMKAINE